MQRFARAEAFDERATRAFAAAWPERPIVQGVLAQIPWYHHIALLEKLDDPVARRWYARQAMDHRNVGTRHPEVRPAHSGSRAGTSDRLPAAVCGGRDVRIRCGNRHSNARNAPRRRRKCDRENSGGSSAAPGRGPEPVAHGKQILVTVSRELTAEFGAGFSYPSLTRMIRFAEWMTNERILATLSQDIELLLAFGRR